LYQAIFGHSAAFILAPWWAVNHLENPPKMAGRRKSGSDVQKLRHPPLEKRITLPRVGGADKKATPPYKQDHFAPGLEPSMRSEPGAFSFSSYYLQLHPSQK